MAVILAAFLILGQDSDVDHIFLRFKQRASQAKTETQYKQALALMRSEFEQFLKDKPKDKDAHRAAWHIAESWLSEQNWDKALEKIDAFLKDYPANEFAPTARLSRADVLLQREDDAGARAAFDEFVKLYPRDERALLARLGHAVTLQNERKYDEAAALLRKARDENKDRRESWGALMQLAVVYHVQEKNIEARATLEEIIRTCPDREPVEAAQRHLAAYLRAGRDAPAFAEKDMKAAEFSLEKQRGKVVVFYFFDSGLTTSMTEAAFLRRAKQAFKPEELQILGVSLDLDRRDPLLFMTEAQVDWPVHFDGKGYDGKLARLYDARLTPTLLVIDRKGKIRFFNVAHRDLKNCISKLLEEK
jgi:TolA-binding protein